MLQNRDNYTADVVVPCYHEEEALPVTAPKILQHFRSLASDPANGLSSFRLLLVDDGSQDDTWGIIERLAGSNQEVVGIKLARNYGHQAAMLSGLTNAHADVVITMDADLQDDITAVDRMLAAYEAGAHMALGKSVV